MLDPFSEPHGIKLGQSVPMALDNHCCTRESAKHCGHTDIIAP